MVANDWKPPTYRATEEEVMTAVTFLSPKELVHLSAVILDAAAGKLKNIRARKMVQILSTDVQRLESEAHE